MKNILTFIFSSFTALSFAQNPVTDLSDVLLDRGSMYSQRFCFQEDGHFQLITKGYFYKFDPNGSLIGKPEENTSAKAKSFHHEACDWYDKSSGELYKYDGENHFQVYKLNSNGPNEITDIEIPALQGLKNEIGNASGSITKLDGSRVMLVLGYVARLVNSHGPVKAKNGTSNSFIRVLKIDTETRKVEESYHFIDKLSYNTRDFNELDLEINSVTPENIQVTTLVAKSRKGGEYEPIVKLNGTCQVWNIDLEKNLEEKIAEIPVASPERTRYYDISLIKDGCIANWTEDISGSKSYSMHSSRSVYQNGEWETERMDIPTDLLTAQFPGMPEYLNSFKMKDGSEVRILQGNFAKTREDRQVRNRLVLIDDSGAITFREMHKDLPYWRFGYSDNGNLCNYAIENGLTEDQAELLSKPLMKGPSASYLYNDNSFVADRVGDELMIIHYDWRAQEGKPDYKMQVLKFPL